MRTCRVKPRIQKRIKKSKRVGGLEPRCLSPSKVAWYVTARSKDKWTRRPEKPCAQRPLGGSITNNHGFESSCPLTLCDIGRLPAEGLSPFLCERHAIPPGPPPQGAGVPHREKGHKRVLHTARPSADVTVIIIIPLPQMAWLPPSPPARRPLSAVPRDVKGPQAPGFLQGLQAQCGPASSSQRLSSGAGTQVAVIGRLLCRAPRGGVSGVALEQRPAGSWQGAIRVQCTMALGAGGFAPGRHLHNVWGRNRCPVNRQL